MQEELDNKFSQVGALVSKANEEKKRLSTLKEFYAKHKDALRELVTYAAMKVDGKKVLLTENETYKSLTEQERKLMESEAGVFSMKQFIESKKNETNYANTLADCLRMINEINEEVANYANNK